MKKCFILVLVLALVAAMAILAFADKEPAAGDKVSYEVEKVWESNEDQEDPEPGVVHGEWSHNSGNLAITYKDGYMYGSQFKSGDGSANLRKWGTGGDKCDPLITGFVFNIKEVGNTGLMYGINGDVGSSGDSFVRITLNKETQQYDIKVLDADKEGSYVTVKTNVSLNEDHAIDAVFYCGDAQYVISLDGVVLGVYNYFGPFGDGKVSNLRIDLLGENATIGVKDIYVGSGSASYEENTETGDASIIVIAVFAVALAAAVVFTKKRAF